MVTLSFLKDTFSRYRILSWSVFSSSGLNRLFYCLWLPLFLWKFQPLISLIIDLLKIVFFLFWLLLRFFSFSFVFTSFTVMSLHVVFLVCLHLRFTELLTSIIKHDLVCFTSCGKFLIKLSSNIASDPILSLVFLWNSHCTYVRHVHPNLLSLVFSVLRPFFSVCFKSSIFC